MNKVHILPRNCLLYL